MRKISTIIIQMIKDLDLPKARLLEIQASIAILINNKSNKITK